MAQTVNFSVDFQGPLSATWGGPLFAGDILQPTPPAPAIAPPPLPLPTPVVTEAMLGIVPGMGMVEAEVDALSHGRDMPGPFSPLGPFPFTVHFSVDEHAVSWGPMMPPDTFTEGPMGGGLEASADVFQSPLMPFIPPPGPGPMGPNWAVYDGDGFPSMAGTPPYPGVGLLEPNPPTPLILPDPGANLDALTVDYGAPSKFPAFFSMDSAFPDPLEVAPANSGTAMANGFVGGDVVVTPAAGAGPMMYAPAVVLGLDLVVGRDSDDLDALMLWDDGNLMFNPGLDILVFSVRRGSAVVGAPDCLWGAPIEEGDLLMDPASALMWTGMPAASPFPAIFMPAEFLGLYTTRWGVPNPGGFPFGDELDALAPEPATLALMGLGALGLVARRRRK